MSRLDDRRSHFYRNGLCHNANLLFRGNRTQGYLSADHFRALKCCLRRIKPAQQQFFFGGVQLNTILGWQACREIWVSFPVVMSVYWVNIQSILTRLRIEKENWILQAGRNDNVSRRNVSNPYRGTVATAYVVALRDGVDFVVAKQEERRGRQSRRKISPRWMDG